MHYGRGYRETRSMLKVTDLVDQVTLFNLAKAMAGAK